MKKYHVKFTNPDNKNDVRYVSFSLPVLPDQTDSSRRDSARAVAFFYVMKRKHADFNELVQFTYILEVDEIPSDVVNFLLAN